VNLRATHYGYTYQDLLTSVALVDLMLGTATDITVDAKGFEGDRFDDLTINYGSGRRVRVQIKHTEQDRELSRATFSADGRSLKLNYLFDALLSDLAAHSASTYRVIVRDGAPAADLATVLRPVDPALDPGDPLFGVSTRRYKFDPDALRATAPWQNHATVRFGTAPASPTSPSPDAFKWTELVSVGTLVLVELNSASHVKELPCHGYRYCAHQGRPCDRRTRVTCSSLHVTLEEGHRRRCRT
jgi:hypothetical protein